MNRRHIQQILRQAAALGRCAESDADLLRRFAGKRDEAAFEALVHRHGRLVWALCRSLLPSEADAEDAFQATFLALVRSPGAIRDGNRVGPWLHGVAYRVCLRSRRAAARRKRREAAAAAAEANRPVADSAWDATLAAVHEEVCRLPESLRVPFVLCCLEGRGATEAAEQLGWKLGTLSARLTRARQALIDRLAGRGLPVAAAAAVVAAGGTTTARVPAAVAVRAAELVSTAEQISPAILSLTYGVTGMAMYRVKLLAAALLLTGGLATTIGSGWLTTAAAQPAKTPDAPKPPAAKAPTAAQTLREALLEVKEPASKWEYQFVVVSEMGSTKFVQFLHDQEALGWEFNGQVTLQQYDGKAASVWMFRRPAGQGKKALSTFVPDMDLTITPVQDQWVPNVTARLLVDSFAPANRATALEAQIRALQAELTRLREQNKKTLTLPANVVGSNPIDLVDLVAKLATRRFGESARKRLQIGATSKGLTLTGDAEAVDWAADIVKRITGK